MKALFTVLASVTNIFSLVIFIRIILTWFSGMNSSGPALFLSRITDPYLNWFRRFRFLQIGYLDLSPVAGIAILSLLGQIFNALAFYGKITAGVVLAMLLSAVWSAVSFILGFCILLLALRLFAYLSRANIYSVFWRVVDTICQPLLYRLNRILFGARIVRYLTGILTSLAVLGALFGAGYALIPWAVRGLASLPF